MKKALKQILILGMSLALAGTLLLPLLQDPQPADPASPDQVGEALETAKPAQVVKVSPAQISRLRASLDFTGEAATDTNVEVIPEVGGKVTELSVKIGDPVTKGETIIAIIDPSRPGTPFAKYRLLSPITGTVTSVSAQVGAIVGTTTPIATVGNLEELRVSVQVPETMIAGLKPGLSAEIRFNAYPGTFFWAEIATINQIVDPASRTLKVNLKLAKRDKRIMPGLFAQVRLFLETRAPQVTVPQAAVLADNGKPYVYLYFQGKALRRQVRTGISAEGLTEISAGLSAGEQVVVSGHENLEDGMALSLVPTEKEAYK